MSIKLKFAMLLVFILPYLYAGEDESLFTTLQSYLARYRQSINKADIKIENGVIYIALDGRRTNHKSLLLLGFNAVGRSLQKQNYTLHQVQIIINYKIKDDQKIVATATIATVLSLSQGQMSPDQFFSKVRY